MSNILSIDPGSRYCGIAIYSGDKDLYKTMEIENGNYQLLWRFLIDGSWAYVVCEDFTAKFISAHGIATVRIIGGVEAICMARKIQFNRPRAQDRLPFQDRALKLLAEINNGKLPPRDHQLSALSHMLRFRVMMLGEKI